MKIALACDHGGLVLKNTLLQYLKEHGYSVVDFGTYSEESCDYPDFVLPAAKAVANGECDKGIVICSTGIGVSIVANKVKGIRCAHCHDTYSAKYTRLHNDANMLSFGQKIIGEGLMLEIVETFLNTDFEGGGRHLRRVNKILEIEKEFFK